MSYFHPLDKLNRSFIKNYHVRGHFDVTMTKRQNTHITKNVYGVIMMSFLTKTLEILISSDKGKLS